MMLIECDAGYPNLIVVMLYKVSCQLVGALISV